jgi:hypothetical protein
MGLRRTRPFAARRGRRGGVTVGLTEGERQVLAGLLDDVAGLLEPDPVDAPAAADPWQQLEAALRVEPPSDPAVARLLPPGHREDDELAQGYRRLTEQSLREAKQTGLTRAGAALRRDQDPVVLNAEEAAALLKGLTDVRLVLAERIGLRTDEDATGLHDELARLIRRAEGGEPLDRVEEHWATMASLYETLTWWQEALVTSLR